MRKSLVTLAVVSLILGVSAVSTAQEAEALIASRFVNVQIPEQKQNYGEVSAAVKLYRQAHELLIAGKLQAATESFRKVVKEYPDHHIADDAAFWIGKANEENKNLDTAQAAYEDFRERFPDSEFRAEATFNLGNVVATIAGNQNLDEYHVKAAMIYRLFILENPGHKMLPDAFFRQGLSLYKFGNINMAKLVWQELVNLYPTSAAAGKAKEWLNDSW